MNSNRSRRLRFFNGDNLSDLLSDRDLSDLPKLYASSLTAIGAGLMPAATLQKLAKYAASKKSCLVILESYRLENGLQIPCIHYGITYPGYEDFCATLSPDKKISTMLGEMNKLLAQIQKTENLPFVFDVWLESVG